ncbi:MAG: rhamnogalacturonan acetylesterase [Rikenellaceae bacterium]|nr:rhamnogalacturonan acetylesterase [Rikenellaceae bacterium]
MNRKLLFLPVVLVCLYCCITPANGQNPLYEFDFGAGNKQTGNEAYSPQRGYGIDFGTTAGLQDNVLASDKPFYFSVDLPEGNYKVTVTFGGTDYETETVLKAESRRLFSNAVRTAPGETVTKEFVINVRTPQIEGTDSVRLNPREYGKLDWDNKLTLEFNGKNPAIESVSIEKAENVTTLFLTGDSTVVDQDEEPWNSWGQMLTNFFDTNIAVANYAESGQALYSFRSSKRLAKVLSQIKAGDYMFIQFGHNDMKRKGDGIGPWTSYTDDLKSYVNAAREKGATPVLVTSMHRRSFDENGKVRNTFGDYIDAVRKVAADENVILIDLNKMSEAFYEALGPEGSAVAFQDGTHHNNYGSYELAKMIVEGIIENDLDIAEFVIKDFVRFNPAYPDDPEVFYMPASPRKSLEKPLGD